MIRKICLITLFIAILIGELFSPSLVYARVSSIRLQSGGCGPVTVWTPNFKWSPLWRIKQHGQAWYHIQSCITVDAHGYMWAQTSVFHSSGPAYALGNCYVDTGLDSPGDNNTAGTEPTLFNCNKGITVHYEYTGYVLNSPYTALGRVKVDGINQSGYAKSKQLTVTH